MSDVEKPFSPACERNRGPILAVLARFFADRRRVLEIGSGTGQHAVHFAADLPQLEWQCSDRPANLPGLRLWLDEARLANTPPPLALDVALGPWPPPAFDAAYSANTLHIMGWDEVVALFAGLGAVLAADARLAIYGPFLRAGVPTRPSNEAFDAELRAQDPRMGLRELQAVLDLAASIGLDLIEVVDMPANNLMLLMASRSRRRTLGDDL